MISMSQISSRSFAVEEILAQTDSATIRKLYNVKDYTSTLEFLTMVALTTGRLLKVRLRAHTPSFVVSKSVAPQTSSPQRVRSSLTGITRRSHTSRSHPRYTPRYPLYRA